MYTLIRIFNFNPKNNTKDKYMRQVANVIMSIKAIFEFKKYIQYFSSGSANYIFNE